MLYAVIKTQDGTKHLFKAQDEDAISNCIYGIVGTSDEEVSGCPTFMEASG